MEKEIKPNTQRIVAALKNWSPRGLCDGVLVRENGERQKTQACAIGCLALDFAVSRSGRRFFKKIGVDRKEYIKTSLYGRPGLRDEFEVAVKKYYGLTQDMVADIMHYNDNCILTGGKDDNNVPASVRKTVYSLRKRYEKLKWGK